MADLAPDREYFKDYLVELRRQYTQYHQFKENFAYLATTLYLGWSLFVCDWVEEHGGRFVEGHPVLILLWVLIAGATFMYLLFQLHFRRFSRDLVQACNLITSKLIEDSGASLDLAWKQSTRYAYFRGPTSLVEELDGAKKGWRVEGWTGPRVTTVIMLALFFAATITTLSITSEYLG